MTDEEKAENYAKGLCKTCTFDTCRHNALQTCAIKESLKQAYLDGHTEGRKEKWHDLRKNPNDLPKENGEYWCKWEDGSYSTGHYFQDNGFGDYVIAWCELPKFEE